VSDHDLTIGAISARRWECVLLRPREKKPAGSHWQVSSNASAIEDHLARSGNVGLVAHERNGLAIIDPDNLDAWADMIDTLGQPSLPWVHTGSGRLHYYVKWQPNLPAKLTWRGELVGEIQRGPGQQQVVAPPSIHPTTGKPYRWLVDPATETLPELPGDWRTCDGDSYRDGETAQGPTSMVTSSRHASLTIMDRTPSAMLRTPSGGVQERLQSVRTADALSCPVCRLRGRQTVRAARCRASATAKDGTWHGRRRFAKRVLHSKRP
jgi:hypothetical protein